MKEFRTIETNSLVVGAGSAGMRASIKVGKQGARSILACAYANIIESPEMKYQRLMQFASQWVLPTMPMAQAQGAEFNIPEATETMAEYLGLDNFNQMYRTAIPHELQGVGYQMQPFGQKKQEAQGQENDAFGALVGSREAQSGRKQEAEDLKVGI